MKGRILKEDRKGFTLVELIVVIAILAILAAVAYPVYTGYITKANEAADQVLLGAVNESFRSALIDEGVSDGKPDNATASFMEGTRKIGGIQYLIQSSANDLTDTFMHYYKGNEDTKFKVIEELGYDKTSGCFYGVYSTKTGQKYMLSNGNSLTRGKTDVYGNTEWTWKKGEQEITFTAKEGDIQAFNDSSFKNVGIDSLMQEVDKLAVAMSNVIKDSTADDYLTKALRDKLAAVYTDTNSEEYKKAAANALVVQAAMHSDTWTSEDIVQFMRTGNFYGSMPETQAGDGQYAYLASLTALQYAMVTAYAKSDVGSSTNIKIQGDGFNYNGPIGKFYEENVSDIINNGAMPSQAYGGISKLFDAMIKTGEYKTYLDTEGQKDIDGYLGAMEFIRDNQDAIIENRVMDNGFGDSDLTEMLNALFAG